MAIERISLAYPRGECSGVGIARTTFLEKLYNSGGTVYGYHQIVHNRRIVNYFESKGGRFVNDLEEIPQGSTVVFSAHGVSPDVRKDAQNRGLNVLDATCPIIKNIHDEVIKFAASGYNIILIGHENHDEVVGIAGEAPGQTWIVTTMSDVRKLPEFKGKLAYVAQTTLNMYDTLDIVSSLKEWFPFIEEPSKKCSCYATSQRQDAVRQLASSNPRPNVMLVFGSENSSNANKLLKIARSYRIDSYMLDSIKELDKSWLKRKNAVGITSGASVPDEVVQEATDFFIQQLGVPKEAIYDFRDLYSPKKQ
jgi:4-hydroxy-3-methylbut-2-enyl diphosphate reductase